MPLPASVLRQFNKVPANPSEAEFHGPYNKLLNIVFPPDSRYTVIPQYWGSRESADFIVRFEVVLDDPDRTVFVLDLKPPSHLRLVSKRELGDLQIRERLRDVIDCPLPTLHGVSAMGTRLSFYSKQGNGSINPPRILPDPQLMTDVAPLERWSWDIRSEDGLTKFLAVAEEVKAGCEAVQAGDDE